MRSLVKLPADELVLDLGAGTSFAVLNMFNAAYRKMVVLTPDPTAIQDTYAFLKTSLLRQVKTRLGSRSKHIDPDVREVVLGAIEGKGAQRVKSMRELDGRLSAVSKDASRVLEEILEGTRRGWS